MDRARRPFHSGEVSKWSRAMAAIPHQQRPPTAQSIGLHLDRIAK